MRASNFACLFTLVAGMSVCLFTPASAKITMTPYLQAVTQTSIYVMVESDTKDAVTVSYGPTDAYGNTSSDDTPVATDGGTFVHHIKLSGLTADSLYHYQAVQGTDKSADSTFNTAVKPGTPYRFIWMGDNKAGVATHDIIALEMAKANGRVYLQGGDTCEDGSFDLWHSQFFRPNELAVISKVPMFGTIGNHEAPDKTNLAAFYQAPDSTSGVQDYYSFDYGDVHFANIDSFDAPYTVTSAQYKWLAADLAASKATWKIVFSHNHPYCAGGHGEDKNLKVIATNILEPNHVDLMISGHSHFYEHNLVNGINYIISAGGGADNYKPGNASYVLKSSQSHHFMTVDVTPTTLHIVVIDDHAMQMDEITLTKPAATPVPAP